MRKPMLTFWRLTVPLALLLTFMAGGCKDDESGSAAVSGSVSVQGASAADVIVELYDLPSLQDNNTWTTLAAQSSVGFPYRVQAIFDWRAAAQSLRARTTTGGGGAFELSGVPDGRYVIIARKSSFGWSAPRVIELRGQAVSAGTLTLFPETVLENGTAISENTTWLTGRHYVVEQMLIVEEGAALTIEPGAVVRFGDRGNMNVFGEVIATGTSDSYVIFTSDQGNPQAFDWYYVYVAQGARPPVFRYCSFRYCDAAIVSATGGGIVENCYFAVVGSQAITLTGSRAAPTDSVLVRRNVVNNVPVGMEIQQTITSPLVVEHNGLFDCSVFGMVLDSIYTGDIYCNWFHNCGRSDTLPGPVTGVISMAHTRNTEFHRNYFQLSWYALSLGSKVDSSTHIHSNSFFRINRVMNVATTPQRYGPSFPTFRGNSIELCDRYNIFMHSCQVNTEQIQAPDNYWGTASESAIRSRFNDCQNDPTCPCIMYQPYLSAPPGSGVGICED